MLLRRQSEAGSGFNFIGKISLNGKIAVLERGNLETGDKRFLSLFKRGNDAQDLRKNGKSAGRLLLININSMVHAKAAQIEVLHPKEESVQAFLPEDDGNGLSQELFVYDAVIRVSPFEGLHSADGLMQEVFSALWQGTLARQQITTAGNGCVCARWCWANKFQIDMIQTQTTKLTIAVSQSPCRLEHSSGHQGVEVRRRVNVQGYMMMERTDLPGSKIQQNVI
ncbi:hypothetical protein WJX77_002610 [Trebouxia sp. C0004]